MYPLEQGVYIYLTLIFLAFVIFFTGLGAIIFARRSLVLVLIGLELMLLAISFLCLLAAKLTGTTMGQLSLFVFLVLGGAESGIGLALIMLYYYQKGTILLKDIKDLKY